MVLRRTGFRDRDIVTLSKSQRRLKWGRQWELLSNCPGARQSCWVSGEYWGLCCVQHYTPCVSVRVFLCVWETVSLDSQRNHKPQQTPRAESSIWNPIIGDQEENSSTRLRASSLCWLGPWGKRVCARRKWKIDEWNMICTWFTVHHLFQVACEDDWFLGIIFSVLCFFLY